LCRPCSRSPTRSLLLPFKAILLNLLSVSVSHGMLVVFFRWGVGARTLGLYRVDQIEGWIPILLFSLLRAVAERLERTGRIVTATAIIMVAAFAGFLDGRIAGLQEFGLGLVVAILVDATIVRAVLVSALMAVLGRWTWWLPSAPARLAHVEASPLTPGPKRSC
jgi:RND superfamily putative drug exporter